MKKLLTQSDFARDTTPILESVGERQYQPQQEIQNYQIALGIQSERCFRYWSPWLLLFAAVWLVGYFSLTPNPAALFKRNWIFIPVGFCGAVLGNISAVGGGIVFIPVIMFVFHLPPVTALKIALASQSWGMTSGAIGWMQKKVVPLRALKLTVPGLLIGSCIRAC